MNSLTSSFRRRVLAGVELGQHFKVEVMSHTYAEVLGCDWDWPGLFRAVDADNGWLIARPRSEFGW